MRKLQTKVNGQRPYPSSCRRRLTVSKGAESLREPLHQQEDSAANNASPEQSADNQNQKCGCAASRFVRYIKMFECLFVHRLTPGLLPEKLRASRMRQTVLRRCRLLFDRGALKCIVDLALVSLALPLRRTYRWHRRCIGLWACKVNCRHKTCDIVSTDVDVELASGDPPFNQRIGLWALPQRQPSPCESIPLPSCYRVPSAPDHLQPCPRPRCGWHPARRCSMGICVAMRLRSMDFAVWVCIRRRSFARKVPALECQGHSQQW
jgi:hypothetical protein